MAEITNCQDLASFNLMEGLSKTILVPGRPPLWTPSSVRVRLAADDGEYYRDENAARFPDYPLEPVVRSIFHMDPSFDTSSIDIVACGSTVGNLLRFVRGKSEPFSFTLDTIGNTTFFIRRSSSPTELIDNVHGFGHRFVEANTTWSHDVKGSSSHQRIITYQLGHRTIVLRFEADGYLIHQAEDFDSDNDAGGVPVKDTSLDEVFKNMLSSRTRIETADEATLQERGSRTVQSSVIDIKTRSVRKQRDDVMAEQLPRLWLRQIDNVVLSFHENGLFAPAGVDSVRSSILDWENDHQSDIARLVNLLDIIKEAGEHAQGRKLEVRCDEVATLRFHELAPTEQNRWSAVPHELRKKWEQRAE